MEGRKSAFNFMIEVGKVKSVQFKAEFFSGALTHTLSSSTPLTITPSTGKILRLDSLYGAVDVANVTVTVGQISVVSNKTLGNQVSGIDGQFVISWVGGQTAYSATSSALGPLVALEPDQSITISTTSPSNTINYSYSYGE